MNINNFLIKFLLLSIIIPGNSSAQDISIHNLIGKSPNAVIQKYGNPAHKDNSNPEMICMFYKSGNNTMIFVADNTGVYQAEATKSYDNESSARNDITNFIKTSTTNGFVTDTVSINDFNLIKTGVKVDLQISENKLTSKFDIRVKANRSED